MKKKLFFGAALALTLAFAPVSTVFGATYFSGNNEGNVVVSGDKEYRNLYVGGGNVFINQKILGDLFSAGGSVNITSEVEEDLFSAGGNVTVSGDVLGDARIAGGNVVINSPISGDLLVAGGTVSLGEEAIINGDLWIAGGTVNVNSNVLGNTRIAGGEVYINSELSGTVELKVDKKLVFGPKAKVLNSISYTGKKTPVIEDGAQVGTIDTKTPEKNDVEKNWKGFLTGIAIFKAIMLLVAGLVLFKVFRKRSQELVTSTQEKLWNNLGWGLVGVIVIPILSLILMTTFIGAFLGIILFLWFLFALMLCSVISMFVVGKYIEKWLHRKKGETNTIGWMTIVWGVVGGIILSFIPILGWIAMCGIYLATFGSMLKMVKHRIIG